MWAPGIELRSLGLAGGTVYLLSILWASSYLIATEVAKHSTLSSYVSLLLEVASFQEPYGSKSSGHLLVRAEGLRGDEPVGETSSRVERWLRGGPGAT